VPAPSELEPMPANHSIDRVAIALGVFEAAQRQHPQPFAQDRAVGLIGEGAAVARG
jgi:hypothetical protein